MLDDSDTTDLASNNDIMQNIEDKEKLDKLNNVLQNYRLNKEKYLSCANLINYRTKKLPR